MIITIAISIASIILFAFYMYIIIEVGLAYTFDHPSDQTIWGWVKVVFWPITYSKTIGIWIRDFVYDIFKRKS